MGFPNVKSEQTNQIRRSIEASRCARSRRAREWFRWAICRLAPGWTCNSLECMIASLMATYTEANVPTPALIIDVPIMVRNVKRMAEYVRSHKLNLRPHTKTHKSVQIGRAHV